MRTGGGGRHRRKKRGVLPKGAGAVKCLDCLVVARADGEGSPIVLHHEHWCPQYKYPN